MPHSACAPEAACLPVTAQGGGARQDHAETGWGDDDPRVDITGLPDGYAYNHDRRTDGNARGAECEARGHSGKVLGSWRVRNASWPWQSGIILGRGQGDGQTGLRSCGVRLYPVFDRCRTCRQGRYIAEAA